MKKQLLLFVISSLMTFISNAQMDTTSVVGIFERIMNEVKSYKLDTSTVPNDKITRKINELRRLRGGFNINEAIMFKMGEEEQKKETAKATLDYLKEQFTTGKGKQWLDNAVIHIYRDQFSYKELKQLVKFYRTSAGQKLASDFPFIMMKTLMAAQIIHDTLVNELKK
jgi:hypothetical protein